jgi:hypothetical protein
MERQHLKLYLNVLLRDVSQYLANTLLIQRRRGIKVKPYHESWETKGYFVTTVLSPLVLI